MTTGKYFLQQFNYDDFRHGGVGCADAEKILVSEGFEPVQLPYHHEFSLRARLARFFFARKTVRRLQAGSVLVFIFPVYARLGRWMLDRLSRRRNVKLVCLLADIDGLKDGDPAQLEKELAFLKKIDYFILHNDSMKEWLQGHIRKDARTAQLEFFDFLAPSVTRPRNKSASVVFAGNLEKSRFLSQLHLLSAAHPLLHFHLYGPGITPAMLAQVNVTYHGVKKPEELPGVLEGSFGLVWDGDAIDKPAGSLGEYMRYISHHKLSLYILSGVPLIVPAGAASAALINKYRIGITVNSLHELGERIERVHPDEYRLMQQNMQPLAARISSGSCLRSALEALL